MKDRISTRILENGAVRYAVYDETGAFLRHEYIKIDDEPTEEGTPLTKNNLLTDDASFLLNLQGEETVNRGIISAALSVPRIVFQKTTPGEFLFEAPFTGSYFAVLIGGGGSGAAGLTASSNTVFSGGGSGYVEYQIFFAERGAVKTGRVGAGGLGVMASTSSASASSNVHGEDGETTTLDDASALGGKGGVVDTETSAAGSQPGADGGQPSSDVGKGVTSTGAGNGRAPYGGFLGNNAIPLVFPTLLDFRGLPISCLCAGGGQYETVSIQLPNGKTMSPGVNSTTLSFAQSVTPTDTGAGSGACAQHSRDEPLQRKSGDGAPGGVFIYFLR